MPPTTRPRPSPRSRRRWTQAAKARRQQTLSQLAAGLAHDFNNLLSAINGSATLIASDTDTGTPHRRHADRILAAGTQAARLMNRFMDLGREDSRIGSFDLARATGDAIELFSVILGATTRLDTDLPDAPLRGWGNATEAGQIVLNLLINAQDALAETGGTITVRLAPAASVPGMVAQGRLEPGRDYLCLSVSDTGSGIAPDHQARIFDAYFTTKADGSSGHGGTGLGLATVASLVRQAGGAIALDSTPGKGTRFDVYWPCDEARPAALPDAPGDAAPARLDGMLILVVDDEADVGDVLSSYLERLGAEVAAVTDPEIAIEALTDDPDAWAAVITDWDMGALSGGDVAEAARRANPALPVFVATALARRLTDRRIDSHVTRVFAKPIDLPDLARTLARAARPQPEDTA